jgi:hypothetical protein
MTQSRARAADTLNTPRDPDAPGQPSGLPDGPRPATATDQPDGGAPPDDDPAGGEEAVAKVPPTLIRRVAHKSGQ